MAAELVKRPIAALVAVGGSNSAMAAKRASSTIPIVFVIGGDPVRLGLAASLSRPAGNATGMTIISADLAPKRLGLLGELVPNATALAALTNPNTPEGRGQSSDMLTAALALGLKLRLLEASDERGIEAAFATLIQDKPDALLVGSDPIFDVHRDKLVALVAAAAIPAIYQFRDFAAAGGLMSYDPDIVDAHRQIGIYVGKILKGALPADLPIQQPTKFQLVINLRRPRRLASPYRRSYSPAPTRSSSEAVSNPTAIHQAPLQALRFFVPISASALVLKIPFSTGFAVATVGLFVSTVPFLVVVCEFVAECSSPPHQYSIAAPTARKTFDRCCKKTFATKSAPLKHGDRP
jgi:putative ABC transport system substrate-binding protein